MNEEIGEPGAASIDEISTPMVTLDEVVNTAIARDAMIELLGELLARLAVPVSLGMMRGSPVEEPFVKLHRELVEFGWHNAAEYSAAIRKVLDGSD